MSGLKALARALATLLMLPALAIYYAKAACLGADRALEGSSQTLSLLPGVPGQYLRRAFLQHVLAYCDRSATIEFGVLFSQAGARIDAGAYVGPRSHIGLAHIERDVLLGPGVHVPSGAHIHGSGQDGRPRRDVGLSRQVVRIGAGSWVGSGAIVMADVGRNVIVGAGSVVTRPTGDDVVVVGSPARPVSSRPAASPRGEG